MLLEHPLLPRTLKSFALLTSIYVSFEAPKSPIKQDGRHSNPKRTRGDLRQVVSSL
jgi:hypothetical protein